MLNNNLRNDMSNAALTICSVNYLSKAFVLYDSFHAFHENDSFYLLVVDKKDPKIVFPSGIKVLWVEDLGLEDWKRKAFNFDVIEFNTNVKPMMLLKLLESYDKVMYLDPDIEVFSPIDSVLDDLNTSAVVLTPHYVQPILDGAKPDDIELLKFGAYNLGFVAVSNKPEAREFLSWWSKRCLEYGYYEPQSGLGVDQKWVVIAPSFFEKIKISFDLGLNVAFWNLHERHVDISSEGYFINSVTPLKFVHFSSFSSEQPELIAKKQSRFSLGSRKDFSKLCVEYAAKLKEKDTIYFSEYKYTFDYFDDGSYISPALRRFYSLYKDTLFKDVVDPFEINGPVMEFAKKNGLMVKFGSVAEARLNFKNIDDARFAVKIINFGLRIVLRILGPIRYFNLMRYLAHISSIRNQIGVMKVK